MRGSGWIPFAVASVVWLVVVAIPFVAGLGSIAFGDSSGVAGSADFGLFVRTGLWASAITVGALVLGWWPGRVLGALLGRRGFVPAAALCLIPLCLPPYLMYWLWWQAWLPQSIPHGQPPGFSLHNWVVANDLMDEARAATLFIGLVLWAWPIVAWSIAGAAAILPQREDDLRAIDGLGRFRRWLAQVRTTAPGLGIGAAIVFLFIFNNTTPFDLAGIRTFGYEIKALYAGGGATRDVLLASWPGWLLAAGGVGGVCLIARRRPQFHHRSSRLPIGSLVIAVTLAVLAIGAPIWLVQVSTFTPDQFDLVVRGYRRAAINTASAAAIAGSLGVGISLGLATGWSSRRRWLRWLTSVQAIGWFIMAAVPGAVVASLLENALNRPWLNGVGYQTWVVIVAGYLGRFGFVAVLPALWLVLQETQEDRGMREMDGGVSLGGWWLSCWPRLLGVAAATWGLVTMLSIGEVTATALLQPPGFEAVAGILLNNMHYQRNETVVLMARTLLSLAAATSVGITLIWALLGLARRPSATEPPPRSEGSTEA